MKLTTKGRFAVTAMLDLAMHETDSPITLCTPASTQHSRTSGSSSMADSNSAALLEVFLLSFTNTKAETLMPNIPWSRRALYC